MKQGKPEKTEANNKDSRKPAQLKRWAREAIFMAVIFNAVSVAVDLWRSQEIPEGEMPEMVVSTLQGETLDVKAMSYENLTSIHGRRLLFLR